MRIQINGKLGFGRTNDINKYLGVNINHGRVSKKSLHGIIDKVQKWLSVWKKRSFSFTRRLTLTKAVLNVLPSYTISHRTSFIQLVMSQTNYVMPLYRGIKRGRIVSIGLLGMVCVNLRSIWAQVFEWHIISIMFPCLKWHVRSV